MSDPTSSMNLSIQGGDGPLERASAAATKAANNAGSIGYSMGRWVKRNQQTILFLILMGFVVFIIVQILKQASEAQQADDDYSFISSAGAYILHSKCRSRGGCSQKCPFITEDDPRAIMCKQADSIEMMSGVIRNGLQEDSESIQNALSGLSSEEQTSITEEIKEAQAIKVRCSASLAAIAAKVRSLDTKFGMSDKVTADVINAKNRCTAMETAAVICKNVYVAAVIRSTSCILNARIQNIPTIDHSRIDGYDAKAISSKINANTIKTDFETLSSLIADSVAPESYSAMLLAVQDDLIKADAIILTIAEMTNKAKDSHATVRKLSGCFEIVIDVFKQTTEQTEGFSNDLPGTMNSEQITKFIDDNDYSSAVIRTALEPEIVSNHNKFAKERATFDSGGGVPSVRDDDNDVVKWVGLFGRPTYQRSDGSSADKSSEPLRSIPSDIPEDLMRKNTPRLSFS